MSDPEIASPVDDLFLAERMRVLQLVAPGVSHELTNRFSGIAAYAQVARRDPRLPGEVQADAELLLREVEAARRLSETLLALCRRPRDSRPLDLDAVLRQAAALLAYWTGPGRVELTLGVPDDLPAVEADPGHVIEQVLALAAPGVVSGAIRKLAISAVALPGDPVGIRIQLVSTDASGDDDVAALELPTERLHRG